MRHGHHTFSRLVLAQRYRNQGIYTDARALYIVHNMGYQGKYSVTDFHPHNYLGLAQRCSQAVSFRPGLLNLSKGALTCADCVIAVSPTYMSEIKTPEGGFGLEDVVRWKASERRLGGILNGIDDAWDPETDVHIVRNYSQDTFIDARAECKAALQRELGLRQDASVALLGFVGRLTWQKGVDILGQAIKWLMQEGGKDVSGPVQLILMGHGEKELSDFVRAAERTYPGRVCGYAGFDPFVEHRMMSACDLLIMPSRYEPCGLPQMIAQMYGALPVVSDTGGLRDSVTDIAAGVDQATGFLIGPPPLDQARFRQGLCRALDMFHRRPSEFEHMQRNAMSRNFSWLRAIDEYESNIDEMLDDPPFFTA
eukprot:gnl/TRDRNA2_/TRDRNA2_86934_c1_seq2.p1 gnl/TRDRNA2_/TRDRNA2_86934_c1~~gnl/TRDRNA2_/TRDRNA2_86934_c1_seq2.p1  ORF type:complete len:378 (-),score=58.45 gnl/TRDRNA2_/TRDRNA2_86934_c1_seq2:81-1181(-)